MVNLTRIYTRTGDDGSTALGDLSRTRKTDLRLAAYADANEANAALGVAVACGDLPDDVRAVLLRVQNDLFDVGADLATPLQATYEYPPLRVKDEWVAELEADCDRYLAPLEKLRSFILPVARRGAPTCTRRSPSSAGPSARPGRPSRPTAPSPAPPVARAGSTRRRPPTSTGSRTCSSSSPARPTSTPGATSSGRPAAAGRPPRSARRR